jgi:hypothetical protein
VSFTIVTYDHQNIFIVQATGLTKTFWFDQQQQQQQQLNKKLFFSTFFKPATKLAVSKPFRQINWTCKRLV